MMKEDGNMFGRKPEFAAEITRMPLFAPAAMFTWKGRRNRKRYFIVMLSLTVINAIVSVFFIEALFAEDDILFFWLLVLLVTTYLNFCNLAKRFHDLGKPLTIPAVLVVFSFYDMITFDSILPSGADGIPKLVFYGALCAVGLYCLFAEGDKGDNAYGPDIKRELEAGNQPVPAEQMTVDRNADNNAGGIPKEPELEKEPGAQPGTQPEIQPAERDVCPMCGKKVGDSAAFCPYCGAKLQG